MIAAGTKIQIPRRSFVICQLIQLFKSNELWVCFEESKLSKELPP